MNVTIRSIILLFVLTFFVCSSFAQDDVVVKVSKKKTSIEGKQYFLHTVKKGETLLAISKAYNILQKDIVMENNEAINGLKPKMVLKIPVVEDKSKFIYHTIEKGQTLYSIAKKYNIDVSELQKNNPTVENGLKVGIELKIPRKKVLKDDKNSDSNKNEQSENKPENKKEKKTKTELSAENKIDKKTEQNNLGNNIKTHTIEKGQTYYSLSKKYHITEAQIKEANPELAEKGLKIGDVINIPSTKVSEVSKNKNESAEKTIVKDDSQTKIISSNKSNGQKKEISIEQDVKSKEVVETKNENKDVQKKSEPIKEEKKTETQSKSVEKNTSCDGFDYSSYKKPFKIAMLAPFYISQNRGYVLKGKRKDEEPPVYPKSIKFIEFYQGLLLAIDSLKKSGISTELLVYDTERDSAKIASITKKKEFEDVDLIIGPFFSANLRHFSDFAKSHKIPIVSPLSQNSEFLVDNPFAFQINPSNFTLVNEAANHFSNAKDVNYIIVNTGKKEDSLLLCQFKNKIYEYYDTKFKADPVKFKEVKYKVEGFKGVQNLLDKEIDNVIFIPSTSETVVAKILNMLNTLETKYPIYILGMQSWACEDNIEQDYLFNLQFTYFSSMYVDYKKQEVVNFVNYYRNIYSAEPTKYSFQGYDIMMYFISSLKTYGKYFPNCIVSDTKVNKSGLQTEFKFGKSNEKNGFENTKTYIIQYDKDFNIQQVNKETQENKELKAPVENQ